MRELDPEQFSQAADGYHAVGRRNLTKRTALLLAAITVGITGCADMTGEKNKPLKRDVEVARADSKQLTSQLLGILDLSGKVTDNGPGVGICEGRDSSKFFAIHHPWSIYNVSVSDLKKALDKLKEKMPDSGWEVVGYGPDKSESKSLTLQADHGKKKFSARIKLWKKSNESNAPSMIHAALASACFEAPEGQDVSGEY